MRQPWGQELDLVEEVEGWARRNRTDSRPGDADCSGKPENVQRELSRRSNETSRARTIVGGHGFAIFRQW
jgi:hypothetical protein